MSIQTLVIHDWHPTTSPNARGNYMVIHKRHHVDRDMAWASAMQAGWRPESGRVRLTITLVYPRKYRVDADNLAGRCKGLLDGLKPHAVSRGRGKTAVVVALRDGWIVDDSTEWLDLVVRADVRKGCKSTEITLEGIE